MGLSLSVSVTIVVVMCCAILVEDMKHKHFLHLPNQQLIIVVADSILLVMI